MVLTTFLFCFIVTITFNPEQNNRITSTRRVVPGDVYREGTPWLRGIPYVAGMKCISEYWIED
jgi:hypothetical protein